jgi:hypothetical protein
MVMLMTGLCPFCCCLHRTLCDAIAAVFVSPSLPHSLTLLLLLQWAALTLVMVVLMTGRSLAGRATTPAWMGR